MCFYAYILARETKLIVRWTDITELSKTNSLIVPDSIRVVTRDNKEVYILIMYFYVLLSTQWYIPYCTQSILNFFFVTALFFYVFT